MVFLSREWGRLCKLGQGKHFVRKIRTTADKSRTARNRTITSHVSWNKNGSKSTNITNYKPWPFVLFEMNICCLRGLLRWLTEQINLNSFEVWKSNTNNLSVILYETMSWFPTHGQGISCLIRPGFLDCCRIRGISKSLLLEVIDLKGVYYPDLF